MPNIDWSAIQSLAKARPGVGNPVAAAPQSNPAVANLAAAVAEGAKEPPRPASLFIAKNALNGGELAPEMAARVDQPRYATGCHRMVNMVPLPHGGATRRPGLEMVAEIEADEVALYPFIFSANQSRILEFSANEGEDGGRLRVFFPDGTFYDAGPVPWGHGEIRGLSITQSADVVYVAHRKHPPMKICRHADDDWRVEKIAWVPKIEAPEMDFWQEHPDGFTTCTPYSYKATAIDKITGEESMPSPAVGSTSQKWTATIGDHGAANIISITRPVENASEYRVYREHGGVYGFVGRILAPEPAEDEPGPELPTFTDMVSTPDTEDAVPTPRNPFEGPGEYPSVVFLHQQRLGFAASDNRPMTVWLSQSGNYENMGASVPPHDDDAIEATLAANQANRIVWCVSDRDGLALGTEGGEWTLTGMDGAVLTPSSLAFNAQTSYGSELDAPGAIRAGNTVVFIQRGGRIVREFGYSFTDDKYTAGDLTLMARHIFRGDGRGIVSWAWQPEPYGLLWCALDDGSLASLTYLREHDVIAWARHAFADDGAVESLAAIPGADGAWRLWLGCRRNGKRFVERLRDFALENPPAGYFADGGNAAIPMAELVPCLPETGMQNGTSWLKVEKLNAVKAIVMASAGFSAQMEGEAQNGLGGMALGPVVPVPARGSSYVERGNWSCPLGGGWREGARLHLRIEGDTPATILGLLFTVEVADLSANQK